MTAENSGNRSPGEPAPTTPGKPKDPASRQQKAPDQTTQTGDRSLDHGSSDPEAEKRMPKPPGPK